VGTAGKREHDANNQDRQPIMHGCGHFLCVLKQADAASSSCAGMHAISD
jgi:hypothetical protein